MLDSPVPPTPPPTPTRPRDPAQVEAALAKCRAEFDPSLAEMTEEDLERLLTHATPNTD